MANNPAYRIYMVGPHYERDYVHKILKGGCPCLTGDQPEEAALYHKPCAEFVADCLRRRWLAPHKEVIVEPAVVDLEPLAQCRLSLLQCELQRRRSR